MGQAQPPKTVAELILAQLKLWGARRIYGVIGDAIFGLMDVIAKDKEIQFIAVKHESAASIMASAEARLTGRIGVCVSQMGPGIANLVNGLGDAHLDGLPLLAITGQAPLHKIGTDYKQYINQQALIQPLSCYSTLVSHPNAIGEVLGKALHMATVRRDVAHLSIPSDLFAMVTSAEAQSPPFVSSVIPVQKDLYFILTYLREARCPVVIAGRGARKFASFLVQVVERWGAALFLSPDGNGTVSEDFPFFLGGIGEGGNPYGPELLNQADVVVLVGTDWWPEGYVPSNIRKIQIDSKEEKIGKGTWVEQGIVGDIGLILQQVAQGMADFTPHEEWIGQIQSVKERWAIEKGKEGEEKGSPIPPAAIIRAIEKRIAEDAIVALDYGDSTLWFYRNFRPTRQDVLLSSHWRTMGFALPASLAARLTSPGRQVVAITGDGGLEMVLADLLTATRYNLKITLVVFNNGSLQMEKDKMILKNVQQEGITLTNPDFSLLAQACGWEGYRVEKQEDLDGALHSALSSSKPALVDVLTEQRIHPDYLMKKPT